MKMNEEQKRKAYEGLVLIIEDELSTFDDTLNIATIATKKPKISNLITYTKQIGYVPKEEQEKDILNLEREYKTKLSNFKKIFE